MSSVRKRTTSSRSCGSTWMSLARSLTACWSSELTRRTMGALSSLESSRSSGSWISSDAMSSRSSSEISSATSVAELAWSKTALMQLRIERRATSTGSHCASANTRRRSSSGSVSSGSEIATSSRSPSRLTGSRPCCLANEIGTRMASSGSISLGSSVSRSGRPYRPASTPSSSLSSSSSRSSSTSVRRRPVSSWRLSASLRPSSESLVYLSSASESWSGAGTPRPPLRFDHHDGVEVEVCAQLARHLLGLGLLGVGPELHVVHHLAHLGLRQQRAVVAGLDQAAQLAGGLVGIAEEGHLHHERARALGGLELLHLVLALGFALGLLRAQLRQLLGRVLGGVAVELAAHRVGILGQLDAGLERPLALLELLLRVLHALLGRVAEALAALDREAVQIVGIAHDVRREDDQQVRLADAVSRALEGPAEDRDFGEPRSRVLGAALRFRQDAADHHGLAVAHVDRILDLAVARDRPLTGARGGDARGGV